MAHKLAIASDHIRADSVEAVEFPHLANKYAVYGVPLTVINETIRVEGAVPEAHLVQELMKVVVKKPKGKKKRRKKAKQEEPREAAWHG